MNKSLNQNISQLLEKFQVGTMQIHKDMVVYPLLLEEVEEWDILDSGTALEKKYLTIKEVSEEGSVPELKAITDSPKKILMLEGEELVGAKQNRTLNTSLLLPEKGETVIPVSCTEQGRWRYDEPDFKDSDKLVSSKLRKNIMHSLNTSLERTNLYRADQREVWNEISLYQEQFSRRNPTQSYHRLFEDIKDLIKPYEKHFKPVDKQYGLAVFIQGELQGFEFILNRNVFKKNFKKIIKSYAVDAGLADMGRKRKKRKTFAIPAHYENRDADFREIIKDFVRESLKSTEYVAKSPGLGYDHRLVRGKVEGHVLMYHEKPVTGHLFPFDEARKERGKIDFRDFDVLY